MCHTRDLRLWDVSRDGAHPELYCSEHFPDDRVGKVPRVILSTDETAQHKLLWRAFPEGREGGASTYPSTYRDNPRPQEQAVVHEKPQRSYPRAAVEGMLWLLLLTLLWAMIFDLNAL